MGQLTRKPMNSPGDLLNPVIEGFFFALGFWPAYVGLDWLASHLPAWRRMKATKAAKVLRQVPSRRSTKKRYVITDAGAPDDIIVVNPS